MLSPRPLESRRSPPPWVVIVLLLVGFLVLAVVCLVGTWVGGQR